MEQKEEQVLSTQKKLQASHDPGWNDPPKWAFTPTPAGSTPTKRLLNKRVAFPLNSSGGPGASQPGRAPPPVLPPFLPEPARGELLATAPHVPNIDPSTMRAELEKRALDFDKRQCLQDILYNFKMVIDDQPSSCDKIEEVRRRLDIMKSMWKENKLHEDMYEKVLMLSRALARKDIEEADKIHVDLMTNYPAHCTAWISAIRYLILGLKEKNLTAQDDSTDKSEPTLSKPTDLN
ncbi:steroid receptor RNA activator 1-like [Microplitis mediator]|uniref:steroid receptor RNA activator 1-like n=1 Tax=Microplitis mediator TaxID=375433 RepID=UPI002552802F|nr:steroid receptor RNA activator 1-like [Microplitis mediator]